LEKAKANVREREREGSMCFYTDKKERNNSRLEK
jgi:hypothetical protein